jgi:hypothetical protein
MTLVTKGTESIASHRALRSLSSDTDRRIMLGSKVSSRPMRGKAFHQNRESIEPLPAPCAGLG